MPDLLPKTASYFPEAKRCVCTWHPTFLMAVDIRIDSVSVTGSFYHATAKSGGMYIDTGDVL